MRLHSRLAVDMIRLFMALLVIVFFMTYGRIPNFGSNLMLG